MSLRTTGWLAVATLVLGAFVWWLESRVGSSEDGSGPLFPGLDPAAVVSIAWVSPEGRVRAARKGETWQIVEPLVAPADSSGLDAVARAIRDLRSAGRVESPVEASVYGLGADATRIVFVHGPEESSFALGHETPLGGAVYAAVGDRPGEVHLLPVGQAALFERRLEDLRDRRVLDFAATQASRLRVAARHGEAGFRATLERSGDGWQILVPARLEADGPAVDRLVSDLSLLRAERFVDTPGTLEEDQLMTPEFAVEIEAGGQWHRLELAPSGGPESLRLVRGREDRVYLVRDALVGHLPKSLFALRAKSVSRFDPAAARALEWQAGDGERQRAEAGSEWQEGIAALASLDAQAVVADALGERESAALGLEPARLRIRVLGEDDSVLADLAFGRADARRGLVVRPAGGEVVFSVDPGLEKHLPFPGD